MRILHVVHGFADEAPGGTELYARDLARRQASPAGGGHEVVLFAPTARGDGADLSLAPRDADGAVRRYAFLNRRGAGRSFFERVDFAPAVRAFAALVAEFRPETTHVHHLAGLGAGIFAAARAAGSATAFTVHDHALPCPRGRRVRLDLAPCPTLDRSRCAACVRPAWIEAVRAPSVRTWLGALLPGEHRRLFARRDAAWRAALAHVDLVFAPSAAAAASWREFHAEGPPPVVLPHGSPESGPATPPEFPAGRPGRIVCLGGTHPTKGAATLAAAAALVGPARARVRFYGDGTAAEGAALVRAASGAAAWEGAYAPERVGEILDAADAFVAPSRFPETFGLALREAWSRRRPAIVSDVGALAEAAAGGARALVVPPGDPAALAEAIRRLFGEPGTFARLTGPFADEPRSLALDGVTARYPRR